MQGAEVCFTSASAANCESARRLPGSEYMEISGHILPNGQVTVVYVWEINETSDIRFFGRFEICNRHRSEASCHFLATHTLDSDLFKAAIEALVHRWDKSCRIKDY